MSLFCTYLVVIGYIGVTMYLANQARLTEQEAQRHAVEDSVTVYDMDARRQVEAVRGLLMVGVFFITLFIPFLLLLAFGSAFGEPDPEAVVSVPEVGLPAAAIGVLLAGASALLAFRAVTSQSTRELIARVVSHRGDYNADSIVHTTAIVLVLLLVTGQIIQFIAIGGVEGLTESIEASGIDIGALLFQMSLQVAATLLGVGFAIRRDTAATLERLGLRLPTEEDLRFGAGVGIALIAALFVFGLIVTAITALFSSPALEEANAANQAFNAALISIPALLIVPVAAAIGEELLFRGALQPIFGNLIISIVFALLHTQALLTPGIIFLFIVSYTLGWLRERYSTTAAIIAHFVYNFVQLFLALLLSGASA